MDPVLGGAELEQLLAVLLRLLSPAAVRPGSRPGGNDHDGGPAPASPVPADGAPGGAEPADSAPDGSEPGGTTREGSAPGDRTPGAGAPGDGTPGEATPGGRAPAGLPAVTASEARALTELLAAHGIAQGQLAALLGLEKSTVSRLAAGLESKGWIRRGRDEQNHRYVRLYLTPQGRAVADRIWQAWQSRQARILAGLTAEERAGLATGLRGVLRGLVAEGLLAAPPPPNGQS
jgi:DNA-binding MarR family transcriptional regulator